MRYTREERDTIVRNISDYMQSGRVEYCYDDRGDVRISNTNLSKVKRAWLQALVKEIYQPSNILSYGINTKASKAEQVPHRNGTAQGTKVS